MKTYKYITDTVVAVIDEDGISRMSMLASAVPEEETILPADPIEEPVPQSITFAQLVIGLVAEGWITQAEGEAWLVGTLPAAVETVINSLPLNHQFIARARATRPSEVLRSDPLVSTLAAAQGKTPAQLDEFFRMYSLI
jgi:hypothetical protein